MSRRFAAVKQTPSAVTLLSQMWASRSKGGNDCFDCEYLDLWLQDKVPSMQASNHQHSSTNNISRGNFSRAAGNEGDLNLRKWVRLCEDGGLEEAVEALELLVKHGCFVPRSLFYSILKKCVAEKDLAQGKRVHALTFKFGYEKHTFLANQILRMYAAHGKLQDAILVFAKVPVPSIYMWCSIISAHSEHGKSWEALKFYQQMRYSTVEPNSHVYVATLKACTAAEDLEAGRLVHSDVLRSELECDPYIGNCLVDTYAKACCLEDSYRVFDTLPSRNAVTWNSMIACYAQHGLGHEALLLYECMQQEGVHSADHFTFSCLLKACATIKALQEGKKLHSQVQDKCVEVDIAVGNSLLDMYVKCGSLEDACKIFDTFPTKDCTSWNTMIAGYVQYGLGQEALSLYAGMQQEGMILSDHFTFACLLNACACVGASLQGKQLHLLIQEKGLETIDAVIGTCLVDMYAKCGLLEEAYRALQSLQKRDVVTWNAMIEGFGQRNDVSRAIQCFREMQEHGVKPNEITFSSIIVACSRDGLVKEGQQYFAMMTEDYGIKPTTQLYTCMIDLLGRSGYLADAENMLLRMPFQNNIGWTSLMNACQSHGDMERGKRCFDGLTRLEPDDASAYVLMENIYAGVGKWKEVSLVESLRNSAGACKKPAKAIIEVNSQVHSFSAGEGRNDIPFKLRNVNTHLKSVGGYVPYTELVVKPMLVSNICG